MKIELEEVQDYWMDPSDEGNQPMSYITSNRNDRRSGILLDAMPTLELKNNARILEVGCNIGRNLDMLRRKGYTNLSGVEINYEAVQLMKDHYGKTFQASEIANSSIENYPIKFGGFDLIFTMAVLMHLPYDSDWVFDKLVKGTKKYLLIIEEEDCVKSWSHYPRDYKKMFENLGMKQMYELKNVFESGDYTLRVFKK